MWKAAAVVLIVTVTGATAHAQQQQSAIETLDKSMSDLAREGYEIKAAENLSGDIPKFVLQKAESIVICQINFSDGKENCFQLRSRGVDGRESSRKPSIRVCGWTPSFLQMVTDEVDRLPEGRRALHSSLLGSWTSARACASQNDAICSMRPARSCPASRLIRPPRPSAPDRTREQGSNRGQDSCAP